MQRRMRMHKYNAENDNTSSPLLYEEMRFHGLESFIIEVLEQCSEKDLLAREDYWIGTLRTDIVGFNMRHKTDLRGKKPGETSFLMHLEAYNLYGYIMHRIPGHICGVYCITSLDVGKQYVGCTSDLKVRLRLHRYDCIKHPEKSPKLYADMRTYTVERFKVELLEECTQSDLAARERYWLDALGAEFNGYNLYRKDFRHTDETKQRFSWLRKGRVFSDEHRQNLAQAGEGKKFSDERKKAIQDAMRKRSRLNEEDVKHIRKLIRQGAKPSQIMSIYDISRTTFYDLKYGNSWRDVQADE